MAYETKSKKRSIGRPRKDEVGQYKVRNVDRLIGLKDWEFSHYDKKKKKMYFKKEIVS